MAWYHFWDMHSGGSQKLDWAHIFIEANSEDAAVSVFYNRFDRNPKRVTCTCCGEDYSISESPTLADATSYHRGGRTLENFIAQPEIKILRAEEIQPGEMTTHVPDEGYVWR